MLINIIGDSHVKVFWNEEDFQVFYVDRATAYNIDKIGGSNRTLEKITNCLKQINKNDPLALSFGEIDARIHIYNQYEKNNRQISIDDLIRRTIENYSNLILRLKFNDYKVCILSLPPASIEKFNEYNYPYYGTPEQRSEITRLFNERLKAFARACKIPYVDVYSIAADENGFTKEEFRADHLHLNKKIIPYVRQQLAELKIS